MNINDDIMQLIIRHLSKTSSGADDLALNTWLDESPENTVEFEKIKKVWTNSEAVATAPIDVHSEWNSFKNKHFAEPAHKPKVLFMPTNRWAIFAAAAVLLIGLFIGVKYLNTTPSYTTGAGERLLVELADGSEVILGELTTLTVDEDFNKQKREVTLTGEGFFTIAKNASKPFEIAANNTTTRILGTAFHLVAQQQANYLNVAEGKVAYWENSNNDTLILTRGKRGELKNGKLEKSELTDPNYASWKTGVFVFENKPVLEVIGEIQDYYLFDAPNLNSFNKVNCRFSGNFSDQTLESALEELSLIMGMKYTLKDAVLTIESFSCQ
jgi:ferric-dicitrate binding protein FerR (iron transport regulator)